MELLNPRFPILQLVEESTTQVTMFTQQEANYNKIWLGRLRKEKRAADTYERLPRDRYQWKTMQDKVDTPNTFQDNEKILFEENNSWMKVTGENR